MNNVKAGRNLTGEASPTEDSSHRDGMKTLSKKSDKALCMVIELGSQVEKLENELLESKKEIEALKKEFNDLINS